MENREGRVTIRGVVFDLFHTLVDPEEFKPEGFRTSDAIAGLIGVDRLEFSAYWDATWKVRMSGRKLEVEYLREFAAQSGKMIPSSVLDEADTILERHQLLAIMNPRADVVPSLKLLRTRGYKLGLLSNTFETDVRRWSQSPLAQCFDAAVFSHEIGMTKPELGAYTTVLRRLGLEPSSCVFVGDGGGEELLGAKRAGFGEVAFMRRFVSTNGMRNQGELDELARQADFSIGSLEELCERFVRPRLQ